MLRIATILLLWIAAFVNLNAQTINIEIEDGTADVGSTICLDVKVVSGFEDLIVMQFPITWDPAKLNFSSIQNIYTGLSGFSAGSISTPPNVPDGQLRVTWDDAFVVGQDVPNNTVLFEICFDVVGGGGTTDEVQIEPVITPNSFGVEFVDINGDVTLDQNTGIVTITGGSNNPELDLRISSGMGDPGTMVCVDVTMDNFTDMTKLKFALTWNPNVLEFVSVPTLSNMIEGLDPSDVITPPMTPNDQIRLNWLDPTPAMGETLPDGSFLMRVCFNIIGQPGSASPIRILDVSGYPIDAEWTGGDVDVTVLSGLVTVNGSAPDSLIISAGSDDIQMGDTTCVQITVRSWEDLVNVQFGINYNPGIIEFLEIRNVFPGLPGFSPASIDHPFLGQIRVEWEEPDSLSGGQSVNDFTSLFEVCFVGIGDIGTTSQVRIQGFDAFPMMATGDPDISVPVATRDGEINIIAEPPQELTFSMTSASGNVGDNVCIDVSVDNFTDIIAIQFPFTYDANKLQFDTITNITTLNGFSIGNFGTPPGTTDGQIKLAWDDPTPLTGESLPNGTHMFSICFDIIGGMGTTTDINIQGITGFPIEVYYDDGSSANSFAINPGQVSIGGIPPMDCVEFATGSGTVMAGEEICIPVTTSNFIDIISTQFAITFNENVFEFTGAQNFNPNVPGLGAGSITGSPPNPAGQIRLQWDDALLMGVTLPNDAVLFELCFNAIGSNGASSTLNITTVPGYEVEVYDISTTLLDVCVDDGTITISGNPPMDCLEIITGGGTVMGGDNICVPVSVRQFDMIVSAQFAILFDPAILEYTGAQNFNAALTGIGPGSITGPPMNQAGEIRVLWEDALLAGISLPDDAILFDLCFNAIGTNGSSSDLTVSDVPMFDIEITDNNFQSVDVCTDDVGVINVDGDSPADCFCLTPQDVTVASGDEVCMDVTVCEFIDIVSMQFALTYEPSELNFSSLQNFNNALTNFGLGSFSTPPMVPEGEIRCIWDEPTIMGINLNPGDVLFEICFDAVGSNGSNVSVQIGDGQALDFEVYNEDLEEVDLCPNADNQGNVEITDGMGNPDPLFIDAGTGTVDPGMEICIPIDVDNFENMNMVQFALQWDATLFEFVSVTNVNGGVDGLDASNVNLFAPNEIRFIWTAPDDCQTIPDGSTLFELCLKAIGAGGSSSVLNITDASFLPILATNCDGQITVNHNDGQVSINNINPPDGFTLEVTSVNDACEGDTDVCVDFRAYEFVDIQSLQFTISYDESVIELISFENLNSDVTALSASNLSNSPVGSIRFTWDTGDFTGVTLSDGAILFSICFDVIGLEGDISLLEIGCGTTTPFLCPEALDTAFNEVTPTLINGQIAINCNMVNLEPKICGEAVTNADCSGVPNGAIDLTICPSNGPNWLFEWTGPSCGGGSCDGMEDLTGLEAGTYFVTVTNPNDLSLTTTGSFNVGVDGSPFTMVGSADISDILCFGDNTGSIILSIDDTGANNPEYTWSPAGQGTPIGEDLINAPAGTYTLVANDDSNCPATFGPFVIEQPNSPVQIVSVNETDVDCFGESTGEINLLVSGGTIAPGNNYNFEWTGPSCNNGQCNGMEDLSGLAAGQYSVTIMDDNDCEVISSFSITQPLAPLTAVANVTHQSPGGNLGAINLIPDNGTGPYTYFWTGPGGFVSDEEDINDLFQLGDYCVTITDANNCTYEECWEILYLIVETSPDITHEACAGSCSGSIELNVSGGVGPYECVWEYEDGTQVGNPPSHDIFGLCAGEYSVTITDVGAGNATVVESYTINSLSNLNTTSGVISTYNGFGVSGFGKNDAIIYVNAFNGNPPYDYNWSAPYQNATNDTLYNVAAGFITCEITDASGCKHVETIFVSTPQPISINGMATTNYSGRNVSCFDACDGEAIVAPTGGVPPYTIEWCNGLTSFNAFDLCRGYNCVRVTDANNCVVLDSVFMSFPDPLSANASLGGSGISCDATAILTVTGGTGPYDIIWVTSPAQVGTVATGLCADEYRAIITDANGCQITEVVEIDDGGDPGTVDCLEILDVISPNGDGMNDYFLINCIESFTTNLQIYNRWGQLVFETDNYDNTWNGVNQKGEDLPQGGYFYILEIEGINSERFQGAITVIR